MDQKLRKFVPRSARYILRAQDRKIMRFSLEHNVGEGGIEHTVLVNLSETGVAFLVNAGAEPKLGQRIKVEFPIPGGEQIAWWATVMRVQVFEPRAWFFKKDQFANDEKILVGLRFEQLPEPHTRAIRKGLERSFMQAMRDQQYRNWLYYRSLFFANALKIAAYVLVTAFALGFIYYFSLPDAKYDAKRGTPWGDRFKF